MRRRRRLSEEERELWQRVAASARSLHAGGVPHEGGSPSEAEGPVPAAEPPASPKSLLDVFDPDPLPTRRKFRVGERATPAAQGHDLVPSIRDGLSAQPLNMDHRTHRKMTRGRLDPEAKLDLHGMTLAQAHPELIHFVLSAQDRGLRLILVITGKGKRGEDQGPIPTRIGVLRHQVPHWLRLPPMNAAILQVTEAHLKHGGSGAYYIYLRRTR